MKTDQEKLQAVRQVLKRWRDSWREVNESDYGTGYSLACSINDIKQAIGEDQDTAASEPDTEPGGADASG